MKVIIDNIAEKFTVHPQPFVVCKIKQKDEPSLLEIKDTEDVVILSLIRHLLRYKFLSLLCYNKRVLDCACGSGYGTLVLSENAKEVVGIDKDEVIIDFANKYHKTDKTSFRNILVGDLKEKNSFDVVISVETLEHILPDEVDDFIKVFKECVKDDGIMVFTTPRVDKTKTYVPMNGYNHYREYDKEDFIKILKDNGLNIIQYLIQDFYGNIFYQLPDNVLFPLNSWRECPVQIAVCRKVGNL